MNWWLTATLPHAFTLIIMASTAAATCTNVIWKVMYVKKATTSMKIYINIAYPFCAKHEMK